MIFVTLKIGFATSCERRDLPRQEKGDLWRKEKQMKARDRERSPAPHTDVERIARKLDNLSDAAMGFGIKASLLIEAADMLRHLSDIAYNLERNRDK